VGGGLLSSAEAYDALATAVEGRTQHLAASLKTIRDCLKAGEADPITLEELEEDWEAWKAAHPQPSRGPQSPPTTADDPEAHAGFLAHRLPDHLRNHPDPRVRKHWAHVYAKANALKRSRATEGLLS
jgi:hypothetical protein